MQLFMLSALAISLVAVLFALQNIVPVTVAFLGWTFEGSLALVLFVALIVGALISLLASVPTLVRQRWTATHLRKQVATLEASLQHCQQLLEAAEPRRLAQPGRHDELPVSEARRSSSVIPP
jgi:putative membrane protein